MVNREMRATASSISRSTLVQTRVPILFPRRSGMVAPCDACPSLHIADIALQVGQPRPGPSRRKPDMKQYSPRRPPIFPFPYTMHISQMCSFAVGSFFTILRNVCRSGQGLPQRRLDTSVPDRTMSLEDYFDPILRGCEFRHQASPCDQSRLKKQQTAQEGGSEPNPDVER